MSKFKNWMESSNKILYIMRGISGSGKSHRAKQLGGVIFSTDDLLYQDGEYKFDQNKMGEYHRMNQERARQAMSQGVSPIVIDNTHVEAWEAKPYVEDALRFGYEVKFIEPNTPWKFDAAELTKRNSHGLDRDRIQQMLDLWHPNITVDDVLKSKMPDLA